MTMRRFFIKTGKGLSYKEIADGVEFGSGKVAIDHPDRGVLVYENMEQLRSLSWMLGCEIEYLDPDY